MITYKAARYGFLSVSVSISAADEKVKEVIEFGEKKSDASETAKSKMIALQALHSRHSLKNRQQSVALAPPVIFSKCLAYYLLPVQF